MRYFCQWFMEFVCFALLFKVELEGLCQKLSFKRLKGRIKYEYLAVKVYFIIFKHEVCTLKEIIERKKENIKKQSELRILSLYREIQSLETHVNYLK